MKETRQKILQTAAMRELACLLIGGNAVILLGFPRMTIDIDLLVPAEKRLRWLDLMRDLAFRLLQGTEAFVQFEPGTSEMVPVDLMFVNAPTWKNMDSEARQEIVAEHHVRVPRIEHLIALKLHAAASPTRSKPETDWEDIRQIIRICKLNTDEPGFRAMILRYGGKKALDRIESFLR